MRKFVLTLGILFISFTGLYSEKPVDSKIEYYRIKKLIPDHPLVPPMQIALPLNYICLPAKDYGFKEGYFWAPEGIMDKAIKSMGKNKEGQECFYISPEAPVIHVSLSADVIQTGKDSFSIEPLKNTKDAAGIKLKWGEHPVLFTLEQQGNFSIYKAYVGLNSDEKVLSMTLFPPEQASKSKKAVEEVDQFWMQFLMQTGPLDRFKVSYSEEEMPSEIPVLELSNEDKKAWRTIHKAIMKQEGIIENIPSDQKVEEWTEMLTAQYYGGYKTERSELLDIVIENLKNESLKDHAKGEVSWNLLEKGKNDFIYERLQCKALHDAPPEYEISRIILSKGGIHRISYTKRKEKISSEEKQKWHERLKNHVSMMEKQKAKSFQNGFSLNASMEMPVKEK